MNRDHGERQQTGDCMDDDGEDEGLVSTKRIASKMKQEGKMQYGGGQKQSMRGRYVCIHISCIYFMRVRIPRMGNV